MRFAGSRHSGLRIACVLILWCWVESFRHRLPPDRCTRASAEQGMSFEFSTESIVPAGLQIGKFLRINSVPQRKEGTVGGNPACLISVRSCAELRSPPAFFQASVARGWQSD